MYGEIINYNYNNFGYGFNDVIGYFMQVSLVIEERQGWGKNGVQKGYLNSVEKSQIEISEQDR